MNQRTLIIAIVIVIALSVVAFFLFSSPASTPENGNGEDLTPTPTADVTEPADDMIPVLEDPADTPLIPTEEAETDPDSEAGVQEFTVASTDFAFVPDTLTVTQGQPVRLTFQNTGIHTFTVDELGINEPLRDGSVVEFTPEIAGTFEFYCSTPGHREMGQVGTLVVQ